MYTRNLTPTASVSHAFALFDRFNREMGLRIDYYELNGEFTYVTQTLRNGQDKQADHQGKTFTSAAERDAAALKALEAVRKKAALPAARLKG